MEREQGGDVDLEADVDAVIAEDVQALLMRIGRSLQW